MRRMRSLICLLVIALAVCTATGQQAQTKPMTNADVIRLVKAGMPTDTIVLAMQHGKTRFDTSSDALIALGKAGVDKSIINAMLTSASSSGPSNAKQKTFSPNTTAQNLDDEFAKAALRALIAISEETGTFDKNEGRITVPRATQKMIDDVGVEGRTFVEGAVVSLLSKLFYLKLYINMRREVYTVSSYDDAGKAAANAKANTDPGIIDMTAREKGCNDALDAMLRYRIFTEIPKECSDLSWAKTPPPISE